MDKQITLSALSDELAQTKTKKKDFLVQINRIVPRGKWLNLIRPCYYKGEHGNKPYNLELMLRLHLLQNLYDLADDATAAEVIGSRAVLRILRGGFQQSVARWRYDRTVPQYTGAQWVAGKTVCAGVEPAAKERAAA